MKNKKSTQNLFGLRTFGKYSLQTDNLEASMHGEEISDIEGENYLETA